MSLRLFVLQLWQGWVTSMPLKVKMFYLRLLAISILKFEQTRLFLSVAWGHFQMFFKCFEISQKILMTTFESGRNSEWR